MVVVGATLFLTGRHQGVFGWVTPFSRRTATFSSSRQGAVRLWSSTAVVASTKMIQEVRLMQDMLQRVRAINQPLPDELRGKAMDFVVNGVTLGKVCVL